MKLDTDIRTDVQNELQWDPSVESRGISVNVQEGIVTLFGNVPHFSDKYSAEKIAKRVGRCSRNCQRHHGRIFRYPGSAAIPTLRSPRRMH